MRIIAVGSLEGAIRDYLGSDVGDGISYDGLQMEETISKDGTLERRVEGKKRGPYKKKTRERVQLNRPRPVVLGRGIVR